MLSPRNQIEVATMMASEIKIVDTLFDICDAEFNSRQDVHTSFASAQGESAWTRYYLLHQVRDVASREHLMCSYHLAYVVAKKLAEVWFSRKAEMLRQD